MDIDNVLEWVKAEVIDAVTKWHDMTTAHQGYALIKEELDELWERIRHDQTDFKAMQPEVIQIAAMAVRFVVDLCENPKQT